MPKASGGPETSSLGTYLADARAAKKLKLRDVEEATDGAVSNAYLSQIENGKIKQPSPNILYHLSVVYGRPYDQLMEKAGYIVESTSSPQRNKKHGKAATFAVDDLTSEEEEELLKYLAYLRSRK
jgi:transcriptional regulator with XRE-family HTH domain